MGSLHRFQKLSIQRFLKNHDNPASATIANKDGSGTARMLSTINEFDSCAPMFEGAVEWRIRSSLTAARVDAALVPPTSINEDGLRSKIFEFHPENAVTGAASVTNQPPGPFNAKRNERVVLPEFLKSAVIEDTPAAV
jgi:hypothetical protein